MVGDVGLNVEPINTTQNLHHTYVELDNLEQHGNELKWVERARWLKFEEDVDVLTNNWSPPYIPALSYKALTELRECLSNGRICIDMKVDNFYALSDAIVRKMLEKKLIAPKDVDRLTSILNSTHKHMQEMSDVSNNLGAQLLSAIRSRCNNPRRNTEVSMELSSIHRNPGTLTTSSHFISSRRVSMLIDINNQHGNISNKLPRETEVAKILTAKLDYITQPMAIFVKLKEAIHFVDLNQNTGPVRFVCFVAGPSIDFLADYFQVGRCIGTLLSDSRFLTLAYCSQVDEDLISGIDIFLEKGIVVPSGYWTKQNFIHSIPRWKEYVKMQGVSHYDFDKRRTGIFIPSTRPLDNSLKRTGKPFGCLLKDIKRKIPHCLDDFKQVVDFRCFAAILFIYLAALAPCITFGGLLFEKTGGLLGISEMIISVGASGILFSLFAGQPLIIVGATGPMLILESKICELAKILDVEFLPWRAWIGIWVVVICLLFVGFDMCGLVRHVTRFTEEIFAVLVSIIFIHKAIAFIVHTFNKHPIRQHAHQKRYFRDLSNLSNDLSNCTFSMYNVTYYLSNLEKNFTESNSDDSKHPCYSLMTAILIIMTFMLAIYFRKFRTSQYFSIKIRKFISDFAVIIAVTTIVVGDNFLSDNITKKLSIKKDYFSRKWIVNPLGDQHSIKIGYIFLAIMPAFLVTIILFLETGITAVMLDKKMNQFKNGFGYHLDLLVVAIIVGTCSIFGLPWICASPVNSLSHFHTLTVLSSDHAPGTNPYIVKVKEQRATNMVIHILIVGSVLLIPMLERIPIAVLYGVFLYLGFTSLARLEFINRVQLLFVPYKMHPDTRYVRKVETKKIHIFTLIQVVCVIVLATVKETSFAAIFPFLILCLVPLRRSLKIFFTEEELEDLDNREGEDEDEFGVSEQYETAPFSVSPPRD